MSARPGKWELPSILRGYVDDATLDALVAALRSGALPGGVRFEITPVLDALSEAQARGLAVPPTVCLVGRVADGRWFGLDLGFSSAERRSLVLMRSPEPGCCVGWTPVASWSAPAPADSALADSAPDGSSTVGEFTRATAEAPDVYAMWFDAAAAVALALDDCDERRSRLCSALLRPMYTASSLELMDTVAMELTTSASSSGADPHALRLAECGRDAEAWRKVAAERAIAGRVREALVGLQGALVLGADPRRCELIMERQYNRMGWGWNTRLLRARAEAAKATTSS